MRITRTIKIFNKKRRTKCKIGENLIKNFFITVILVMTVFTSTSYATDDMVIAPAPAATTQPKDIDVVVNGEKLFPQIYKPKDGLKIAATMDLMEKVMENCRFYTIRCNTEIQAAHRAISVVFESDMEKSLRENKVYITTTQGDSMTPMLETGDRVVIVPVTEPLKKYDVPVYRRGDHYTMHRIVRITPDGYVICGDNRTYIERDITDADIVGMLGGFYKDGKFIDAKSPEFIKYGKTAVNGYWIRKIKQKILRTFR